MFGALRFVLAAMVVLFHAGWRPLGVWHGVSAVIVFYILSGYVVTALISTRFSSLRAVPAFLAERSVRILPQYYFWMLAALFFTFIAHWTTVNVRTPDGWTLFSYGTLIPLGLQRYIRDVNFPIIPQATSLAIEVIMYLIAPFVVRSKLLSIIATIGCLGVFLASATGKIPPQIYTYYTAPAQLVFFMLGSFIYRRNWILLSTATAALALILSIGLKEKLYLEILIGVLAGVPIIVWLRNKRSSPIDSLLGNFSYGAFLGQLVIFEILLHFGLKLGTPVFIIVALILSLAAGYGSFLLAERPTIRLRRRLHGPQAFQVGKDAEAALPNAASTQSSAGIA